MKDRLRRIRSIRPSRGTIAVGAALAAVAVGVLQGDRNTPAPESPPPIIRTNEHLSIDLRYSLYEFNGFVDNVVKRDKPGNYWDSFHKFTTVASEAQILQRFKQDTGSIRRNGYIIEDRTYSLYWGEDPNKHFSLGEVVPVQLTISEHRGAEYRRINSAHLSVVLNQRGEIDVTGQKEFNERADKLSTGDIPSPSKEELIDTFSRFAKDPRFENEDGWEEYVYKSYDGTEHVGGGYTKILPLTEGYELVGTIFNSRAATITVRETYLPPKEYTH